MAEKIREGKVRCSFCHKSEDQVRKLIAGPDGAYICDECVVSARRSWKRNLEIRSGRYSMIRHQSVKARGDP